MTENINSGEQYAQVLIDGIMEVENSFPINERMNPSILEYWIEEIKQRANETYTEYIIGKRDNFIFDLDEVQMLFEKAARRHVDETIDSLLEKDLLTMSVDTDGEILYSLSDEGREVANELFGKAKLN